jgi:hypothetical protein
MNKSEAFTLSLCILIPLMTGLVRYRSIPASYRPLILLLFVGLCNELCSYLFFYYTSNAIPTNIYFLCEFLLYIVLFRRWGNILRHKWLFIALMSGMLGVWFVENILFKNLNNFSPVFQVSYSFVLILVAVNQLNWLIVNEKSNILRSPIFILCIAIIVFFSYKVLTEIFYYFAPQTIIKNNIFIIEAYLNVAYNIMLAIAIICIPRRRDFIRQ